MVKNLIVFATFAILYITVFNGQVKADYIAGSSAAIKKSDVEAKANLAQELFIKRMAIKSVLESYNSSLTPAVDSFIDSCKKYNLDCYLLPSITGVESFFGKFLIPNSNNPFGWGGGYIYFGDWNEAIDTVASGLRNNYINRGADTVEKIGPIYATTTTWAPKVQNFIDKFEKEEQKIRLFFNTNKVEL